MADEPVTVLTRERPLSPKTTSVDAPVVVEKSVPKALLAAREYLARGLSPIPLPHGDKSPKRIPGRGWRNLRLIEADLDRQFGGEPRNVGVLLGDPSGGLVDGDLDCPEAIAVADMFLPNTAAIFGRKSKRRSHRLYVSPNVGKTIQFKDVDGTMLVELRSNGAQTVFPGSAHPSGEDVTWDESGEPAEVGSDELRSAFSELAAVCLVARHWPKPGSRQDAALALGGTLLRAGWEQDRVERFVRGVAIAAGDEEVEKRVETVAGTKAKLDTDEAVTGAKKLAELIGQETVQEIGKWLQLPRRATSSKVRSPAGAPVYRATPTGLVWDRMTDDGPVATPLTNFTAMIAAQVKEDDGAETSQQLEIKARLGEVDRSFCISASSFASMNWAVEHLGPRAIVYAGFGTRDHARTAIQMLSPEIKERTVYTHLGWREIPDVGWIYLHNDGAIGPEGPVSGMEVRLPAVLSRFSLPQPPSGEERAAAVRVALDILALGPPRVLLPLIAATWRAALGDTNFSLHLAGPSGVFKTELAALCQSHWGAGFNSQNLPGSWSSTGNSLEAHGFLIKDASFVIDDFAPSGSSYDIQRTHREADRLLRAQGNRSGRGRLRVDGTPRAIRPPRGMVISTGEDVPAGHSLRARMFVLELAPGDIDPRRLSKCQQAAASGTYAQALSAFLVWASASLESLKKGLRCRVLELRADSTRDDQHRRTPTIASEIQAGFEIFLDFAVEVGAIDGTERQDLLKRCWLALTDTAKAQSDHLQAAEPAALFLQLLESAIASGEAHVADADGNAPEEHGPEALGWQQKLGVSWTANGSRVGWIDGDALYLDPSAAVKAAQKMGGDTDRLTVGIRTVIKRLAEKGHLVSQETGRGKHTVRVMLQGSRRAVIHLRSSVLVDRAQSAHQAQEPAPSLDVNGVGPEVRAQKPRENIIRAIERRQGSLSGPPRPRLFGPKGTEGPIRATTDNGSPSRA